MHRPPSHLVSMESSGHTLSNEPKIYGLYVKLCELDAEIVALPQQKMRKINFIGF